MRFSHIMIEKANYDSNEEAYQKALEAKNELNQGISFEEVVSTYSDDIVSKDTGGDLEYFDADIFPQEFGSALESMKLNDTSNIIELEDTFHILKMTEFNETEVKTLEQMEEDIIDDLINSESLALMSDDYDLIDEMIFSNESIESISESVSRTLSEVIGKQSRNFEFEIDDSRVKDFVFSPDSEIGTPVVINLDDSIIVIALTAISEPVLQNYDDVSDEANKLLSQNKTIEKTNLLVSELGIAKKENTLQSFYEEYDFISEESFVEVKRYSSLLPQEVISEVFKIAPGNSVTINTNSGDVYIVDLVSFKRPTTESIDALYGQYNNFSLERVAKNISSIISEDIFDSAKVNLNNLVF